MAEEDKTENRDMDIFESSEFKELEKLCHARKVSFIFGVSKFSSCNKPRKGASYVRSVRRVSKRGRARLTLGLGAGSWELGAGSWELG